MKPLHLFLLLTFVFFFLGFALVGVLISIGSPNYLVVFIQIAMAWTPTAAFGIIHRRTKPEKNLRNSTGTTPSIGIPVLGM